MRKYSYILLLLTLVWGCKDLTNEQPEATEVFVKFFGEADADAFGVDIKQLSDESYLLLGYTVTSTGAVDGFLITTDKHGNTVGNVLIFPGFKASSMALDANEGYYLIGDGIDPVTQLPAMRVITETVDFVVDGNYVAGSLTASVFGTAIDVSTTALALGYVEDGGSVSQLRVGLNFSGLGGPTWVDLTSSGPSYLPGKGILPSGTGHIWTTTRTIGTTSTAQVQTGNPDQPVGNSDQPDAELGEDITPVGSGFTGIGTGTTSGGDDQIIIFHTDASGNVTSSNPLLGDVGRGLSISSTSDGFNFVGLGSVEAQGADRLDFDFVLIPGGGTRIYLGGTGNEVGGGVTPTLDGGYAVFGTSELDGRSSMIFIKTDKNGELKL